MTSKLLLCSALFLAGSTDAALPARSVNKAFAEFPNLKTLFRRIAVDAQIDPQVRAIVAGAVNAIVSGKDVELNRLDLDVAERLKLPLGLSGETTESFVIAPSTWTSNRGEKITDTIAALKSEYPKKFKRRFVIFAADGDPTVDHHNSIMIVFHEFAHIAFIRLFESKMESLVGKFPDDMLWRDSRGKINVRSDLWGYLIERFANENEAVLLKSIMNRPEYFRVVPDQWIELRLHSLGRIKQEIPIQIRRGLNLNEPRLVFLDLKPIETILDEGLDKTRWGPAN